MEEELEISGFIDQSDNMIGLLGFGQMGGRIVSRFQALCLIDESNIRKGLFFVRGISPKKIEMSEYHEVSHFYLVDLCNCCDGGVLSPYCQPIINTTDIGSIVRLGHNIYVSSLEVKQNPINDIDGEGYHHLSGLSLVALRYDNQQTQWKLASAPTDVHNLALSYAVLNAIIYCLPSESLCKVQFYDPLLGHWSYSRYLPPDNISSCLISGKLVPDPTNNRILIHLSEGDLPKPSLYAWYPQGRHDDGPTWEFITLFSTRSWRKKVVLVEDVLFLYFRKTTKLFQAFDLKSKKLLNIRWHKYYPGNLANVRAISMSSLTGGTQLCLTSFYCYISPTDDSCTGSSICFILHNFERVSMDTIAFSYDSTIHFNLPNIKQVTDFICLDD